MNSRIWIWVGLGLIALFIVSGINTIPVLEEKVNASWAQVENNYQRRMDLIPNLVETVKGSASFEQKTLTDVINARSNATKVTLNAENLSDPEAVKNFELAQGKLSYALSRLLVSVEKYPDLKANNNFIALQSQLEGTENRIAISRRDYIETIQEYNTKVRTFPGSIWAMIHGAKPKQSFVATEGASNPPAVKF
jgi:LemA protein